MVPDGVITVKASGDATAVGYLVLVLLMLRTISNNIKTSFVSLCIIFRAAS
jgi:hypothetical protein